MAKKSVYEYTVRVDRSGDFRFSNETGALERPENCISYLLVGVLGCMGITANSIIEKMRIDCDAVIVHGRVHMADEAVRYGERIECDMRLENGPELAAEAKERIVDLTKKHCSVSVTIAKNPGMTLTMV